MPDLPDFSALHILVVGDVMVDRYLHGRVERISPEAPVPVVEFSHREERPGGAANVAINLAALGVRGAVAGAVGMDEAGAILQTQLDGYSITTAGLIADAGRPTTVKTRVLSQGQQLLRIDHEQRHPLDKSVRAELLASIADSDCDLLLLQDYNKGVLSATTIAEILNWAAGRRVPVVVDPKRDNFWAYRGVRLFKPNLREVAQQMDFPVRAERASLDAAAAVLFERLGCEAVMITLSEHGIYLHDGKRSVIYPTAGAQRIVDVSGAGDTVVSVAAAALAAGMSYSALARMANLAAAQVVARPGVVAVDAGELAAAWG